MRWTGLAELQEQLRNLPRELANQAGAIVVGAATDAMSAAVYPASADALNRSKQVVVVSIGPFGVRAVAKNTHRLAYLYEHGTQARHTEIGANRGAMPAGNVFLPPVIRSRRRMYDQLKQLLVENGFRVSGDA